MSIVIPCFGTWRSLVAHLTGGQGVAGSNPVVPTIRSIKPAGNSGFFCYQGGINHFLITDQSRFNHGRFRAYRATGMPAFRYLHIMPLITICMNICLRRTTCSEPVPEIAAYQRFPVLQGISLGATLHRFATIPCRSPCPLVATVVLVVLWRRNRVRLSLLSVSKPPRIANTRAARNNIGRST